MSIAGKMLGAAAAVIWLAAPLAAADEAKSEMDELRQALLSSKKALIEQNLTLSEAEAKEFWPLYDEYESDIEGVQGRVASVVAEYAADHEKITEEQASNLTAAYLLAEEDRATFRRAYLHDFAKILPGKKLARFYQLENKFDAVMRFEFAERIPLVKP